ncbi:MAG: ATP-binding protein [Candidatus Hodarchaeales archaeon]
MLLFGPPGTGKTLLVSDLAIKTGLPFYEVTAGKVLSKWFGESEKKIERLFQAAQQEEEGCILYFDEFDSLVAENRHDSEGINRVKGALLAALDGFSTKKPNKVVVIASTNRPDRLGGAMMRRFDRRVYFPPPDFSAITLLVTQIINRAGLNLDLFTKSGQSLIKSMQGLTAKEITDIINGAIWETADAILDDSEACGKDFLEKIEKFLKGLTPYYCTFDSLEPSVYRFLDYQYGFPKTAHSTYDWEKLFASRKYQLIQFHPKPKVILKQQLTRIL